MADVSGFSDHGLSCEPFPVDGVCRRLPVVPDAQVRHLKADEVVEEVSALAGFDVHARQCGLDDHPGPRDLPPFDGNAKPRIRATPSAESDEQDRKSTRLNSSHSQQSRMPSSA